MASAKIDVENINHPGRTYSVDARIYELVRNAWLAVLAENRKLTLAEISERLPLHLPDEAFCR